MADRIKINLIEYNEVLSRLKDIKSMEAIANKVSEIESTLAESTGESAAVLLEMG